eukprot:TRINITY_DN2049_c0_g1_i1.p1 TRINITY_DN2049_c0_g1~~TRINITY_DN2049_c0_g1_i1.p1  ORF type:complete len:224 (-),score=79.91 TRINITY_DN2049_c0_g1_i1:60-707(-)
MIRRPPRSTPLYSSAASDVYKRQPSLPVTSNAVSNPRTFTLRTQKQNEQGEGPGNQRYSSSKERILIGKIATLRKEKNEICLNSQKDESHLKKQIDKVKSTNQVLKQAMQKIIPLINESASPRMKMQIQESLNRPSVANHAMQCCLALPENDPTPSYSASANKDAFTVEEIRKMKEINEENEQLKVYSRFVMKKGKARDSVMPNFIKSLYISNLS